MEDDEFRYIHTPQQLAEFADIYGLRDNWHEPDEQSIDAHVYGGHLDNAMGPGDLPRPSHDVSWDYDKWRGELNVVLDYTKYYEDGSQDTKAVAVVNLASLLAWASRPYRKVLG